MEKRWENRMGINYGVAQSGFRGDHTQLSNGVRYGVPGTRCPRNPGEGSRCPRRLNSDAGRARPRGKPALQSHDLARLVLGALDHVPVRTSLRPNLLTLDGSSPLCFACPGMWHIWIKNSPHNIRWGVKNFDHGEGNGWAPDEAGIWSQSHRRNPPRGLGQIGVNSDIITRVRGG
jgi:hypothetical protein